MKTVSAGNFKTHCLSLINEVAQNRESIVVIKYGKPVAKLVPFDV
ncbi:MAG: type II toxin-antitoxin system Phd/YefM family antitoxin [bacterium]